MPVVKKQSTQTNHLNKIYYDASNPVSFGGIKPLASESRLPVQTVQKFLNQQWTYQFHKPIRYKFPRRRYMVRGVDEQWQADLVEMQSYSRQNQGNRYILCVIDIFSRFAYTRPIKDKTGKEVSTALKDIITSSGKSPKRLQTDQGKEFYNQYVRQVLDSHNIELFSVYSEKKAAIVERFQRTLQEKLYRAFTYQGNYQWLELLPKLTEAYNHSYHRTIKSRPVDVTTKNETDIWIRQYGNVAKNPKPKFKVGDSVRIPKQKTVFSKGYIEKWTDEIFTIQSINTKYKPELYTLQDDKNESIQGSFYPQELQKVDNTNKLYRIEKVIRKRTLPNKEKQVLVKWIGYRDPTWIDANQLQTI
jgi:Integrase core domain